MSAPAPFSAVAGATATATVGAAAAADDLISAPAGRDASERFRSSMKKKTMKHKDKDDLNRACAYSKYGKRPPLWAYLVLGLCILLLVIIGLMIGRVIPLPWSGYMANKFKKRTDMATLEDGQEPTSVVIMSWARPDNIKLLVDTYLSPAYGEVVGHIYIFNANPKYGDKLNRSLPLQDDRLTLIQTSRDMGLHARFATAMLAKTETVWIQDDDLMMGPEGFRILMDGIEEEPEVMHGVYGRFPVEDKWYPITTTKGHRKRAPILLTQCLIARREHIATFMQYAPVLEARAEHAVPKWNGEDLVLSLSNLIAQDGLMHRLWSDARVHITRLQENDAISGRVGHNQYRADLVRDMGRSHGIHWPKQGGWYDKHTRLNIDRGVEVFPTLTMGKNFRAVLDENRSVTHLNESAGMHDE
jgi:hypothetical protein